MSGKRRGIDPIPGTAEQQAVITFRVPPALKNQLVAAVRANDRSQSAEIVSRLERSFRDDEILQSLQKVIADAVREGCVWLSPPKTIAALIDSEKVVVGFNPASPAGALWATSMPSKSEGQK
jgi:flagellar biosynthesis regulator FlbT